MTARLGRRIVRHHLPLLGIATAITVCIRAAAGLRGLQGWSVATAFASFLLLGAAMSIGPINILRRRPNPVSADLRRDIGIWVAIVAFLHVGIGIQVHLGDPLKYFLIAAPDGTMSLRHDRFGFANYTGLVATFILAMLLAVSSDAALRFLGSRNWKAVQRLTYGLALLAIMHGVVYELIEDRALPLVFVFSATVLAVATLQLQGWNIRRTK
ncbi:MAG: hypothetical protein ABI035_03895 [Gemmatimonadaceae bacterium]